ncbi:MAG: dCTP deaminase [Myxococcota bacterium]
MCVLTRDQILDEIERGRLRIDPFDPDRVGPASIDLHLGAEIRVLDTDRSEPVDVEGGESVPELTRVVEFDAGFVLEPGETVHGITQERLMLPPDLCGWLEGRSSVARLGLTIHATSGFVHPGVQNHQVLEMSNLSRVPLRLRPGIRICQVVLERTEGQAVYRGRFAGQTAP